jgi:glycosyltransferase involved in cell wall biosynthesis
MKVIPHFQGNYPDDPVRLLGFEEFSDRANDCLLFIGCLPDPSIKESSEVPKYLLCLEEQYKPEEDGTFTDPYDLDSYLPYVDKAFTICSPTVTGREGRTNVFFPFNANYIPEPTEKIYDVIYTGFVNVPHVRQLAQIISRYNYRYVSFHMQNGLETNLGVSYEEKIKLVSQSKISVVHNILIYGTPQLKSRTFEAAFSKTLMLVLKDQYNVIEEWFVEGEDFIYFETEKELVEKIDSILENYSDYQFMIDNAYNKAVNEYTTEKFIEKYIGFKK